MTSSPQHNQPEAIQEEAILLDRAKFSVTFKQCCDNVGFYLVTLIIVVDIVTDTWVLVVFGQRKDMAFMGILAALFLVANLVISVAYSTQHRSENEQTMLSMYKNICLNFPFQLGILYHRCIHGLIKCHHCCPRQVSGHTNVHGPRGKPSNLDWKFAKLKLIQSMFQCVPQLIGNVLHMLIYKDVLVIQIVSGVSSFVSIVVGVVLHEKARKEQARGALMGIIKILCILIYKVLVIGTRLTAMVHFIYYFGLWVGAILIPHVSLMFGFYVYLYHQIWKVQYHVIVEHSLYSMFAYFPIHSEYRPEGEIVLFYILFMVENILMVALPFKIQPTMPITRPFHPTSRYYFAMMLLILVGATAGLIFMCAYYFLFHKSRHSIRDTNLGWLACLCEWRKQEEDSITVSVPNGQNHARSPAIIPVESDDTTRDIDTLCQGPLNPGDNSYLHGSEGNQTSLSLAETGADTSLLSTNIVKFVTSAPNPESGSQMERLLVRGESHEQTDSRPSVLEGEDGDSDQEIDERSQIVV